MKRNKMEFYFFFLKKIRKRLIPTRVPMMSAMKSYTSPVRKGTQCSWMISVIPPKIMLMAVANTRALIW